MRIVVASALAVLATAFGAAPSGAAERWAAPTATRTAEPCLAINPCSVARAITGAATADEVLLEPGRYALSAPLVVNGRVTLRGARAERPVIVGDETSEDYAVLTFKNGGTLRHVELQATRGEQDALVLQNAVAEDVVLSSAGGNGAKVFGAPNGTVLRDALVRSGATDGDRAAVRLKEFGGSGDVMLRNVTALAPAANGIRCEVTGGTATIVNSLARGGRKDIKASASGHCQATYSNFRTAGAPLTGAGNQDGDPQLDADGRPAAGSPLIDAGTTDARLGATDLAGCARSFGDAPDIGAYESCAEPVIESPPPPAPVVPTPPVATSTSTVAEPETPAFDTEAELPPDVPAPIQGTSMVVSPSQGKVLVRQPGTNRFRELEAGAQIPVGSEIDASKGRVTLVTSVAGGLQDGTFWGGRFTVSQRRAGDGMTSLVLKGGSFKGCPKTARVSAASANKKKPVRKLWSKDKNGRFRTHGHNSVATARGTNWLTEDTCTGTRTRVLEGAVAVRDTRRKRTTLVRAGESYLARR
jgi:hypothetical protein